MRGENPSYDNVSYLYLGNGSGTAASFTRMPVTDPVIQNGELNAAADMDGNGWPDLLITYQNRAFVGHHGGGTPLNFTWVNYTLNLMGAITCNVDGDSYLDLLVLDDAAISGERTVTIYLGREDLNFSLSTRLTTGIQLPPVTFVDLAWGDFEGDGQSDIIFLGEDARNYFGVRLEGWRTAFLVVYKPSGSGLPPSFVEAISTTLGYFLEYPDQAVFLPPSMTGQDESLLYVHTYNSYMTYQYFGAVITPVNTWTSQVWIYYLFYVTIYLGGSTLFMIGLNGIWKRNIFYVYHGKFPLPTMGGFLFLILSAGVFLFGFCYAPPQLVFTLVYGEGGGWFWSGFALAVIGFSLINVRPYLKKPLKCHRPP